MKTPMAMKDDPINMIPKYELIKTPMSKEPSGAMIKRKDRVHAIITRKTAKVATNFPITIPKSLTGYVSNSSMAPDFFSSENNRIVRSGIRNRRIILMF